MRARFRYAATACASAAVVASLTGCGQPLAGVTGVTVTADGRPVGVLMVCDDHIDGATLYTDGPGDDTTDVATWSRAEPVTGFVSWPMDAAGEGWSVDRAMPAALERQRTYTLYGWTEDNSWSTAHVSFDLTRLAGLTPGQVRYFAGDDVKGADADGNRTAASVAEFRTAACDDA
ncbi:hypothetical protein ABZ725_15655 [Streptomyces sp. NPDC006872]|uniref:hypothetical protein n=1 Tax=Streptomyces sp. NPDC006872 TaxID=3155720 RepID=UPI0033EFF7C5